MKTRVLGLSLLLAACSGSSPILNRVGEETVATRVGPGGATVRGDGGSPLEGLELVIPPGALQRLVDLTIEVGPELAEPGTSAASTPLRIRMSPDPGVLDLPASLGVLVDVPDFRSPDDLVVVGQRSDEAPSALSSAGPRRTVVADHGVLDRPLGRFTFDLRSVGDLQVRLVDAGRMTDDASQLLADGYTDLAAWTSASLIDGDLQLAEAQIADPYLSLANLLRAVSRVLVALDDRRDTGPGIDSVGEALIALGIDVDQISLLERFRTGVWPSDLTVPFGAPTIAELQTFSRLRLRPVLELSLRDLDRVSSNVAAVITLPDVVPALPGEREIDVGDVLVLRALLASAIFAIDWVDGLDLEFDAAALTADPALVPTFAEFFAAHPAFGRLRSLPAARSIDAAREAASIAVAAFGALDAEGDEQTDDIFVLGSNPNARTTLRDNLIALRETLVDGGSRSLRLNGERVDVDLSAPLSSGALEPAFGLPEFLDFLPLAGTAQLPDLGGALPGMTQERWTDLLGLVTPHDLQNFTVLADGVTSDWPIATATLAPVDPPGDTDSGVLRAVDLEQLFLASSGDDLAFRIRLATDSISYRVDQPTAYGVVIRERDHRRLGARIDIVVFLEANGPRVEVSRDGEIREVASGVAFAGRELEITVDRFDLFDPDEPLAARVVRGFSDAVDLGTGAGDGDRTRWVAVTF